MREAFLRRRDLICKLLEGIEGLKVSKPEGAFYVMPDITSFFGKSYNGVVINNSDDMAMYLLEQARVAVVGGIAFGSPECMRISYAVSGVRITEAIKRIKEALGKLK